ncbi:MAG: hypothetical protein ACI8XO_002001 [Verrucomicrobiales bacterium]|jgi:hypothetical protein
MVIIIKRGDCRSQLAFAGHFVALFLGFFAFYASISNAQQMPYSIGEPTAEEQLSLELINRARQDPAAEGIRLAAQALEDVSVYSDIFSFGTNLTTMKNEMAAIAATPPLSFNAELIAIARAHSDQMLAQNEQSHFSGALHYTSRMDNDGYPWSAAAENIFATAHNVEESHASFEIDWGSGSSGMQDGRGHRGRIHSSEYREIGIGFLLGSASSVGPALITQDFGERISLSQMKPYVTGVAIYDADGDGFYDIGEGIKGVIVKVKKVSSGVYEDHYAETSGAGGYSVPVDAGAGDYLVEFEAPGGATWTDTVTITLGSYSKGKNVKSDLIIDESGVPGYTPPVISGETQIPEGSTTVIDFADVAGALEYEVLVAEAIASPLGQDAEAGAPVTTDKSTSYALLAAPLNQGDRLAFHLAHPSSSGGHQSMVLDRVFVPGPAAQISFDSRLRRTGTAQIATLQVSANKGRTWDDVWYQQSSFSYANEMPPVTVDVSDYEGQPIKFRFFFYLGGGSVEYGTGSSRGWHFDDLVFTDMIELSNPVEVSVAVSQYDFTPAESGDCYLQVRARAGDDFLPYANSTLFEVTTNDYAGWVTRREAAADLVAGSLGDSETDFDGDGLSQLMEYAFESAGLDPAKSDYSSLPRAAVEGDAISVHYIRNTALEDVLVGVQVSTDLANWYLPGEPGAPGGFTDTLDAPAVGTLESRTAAVLIGVNDALYMRLHVIEVTP